MRGGEYATITPEALRALRIKHNLSQAQIGMLARSSVYMGKGNTLQSRRVQAWEAGENRMPLAHWELLEVKLKLLEGGSTFEELATRPLVDFWVPWLIRSKKSLLCPHGYDQHELDLGNEVCERCEDERLESKPA